MTARRRSAAGTPTERRRRLSHVRVVAVVRPIDLRTAIAAAGLPCQARLGALRSLASDLNMTIASVLAQRGGPRIADTRATGNDLAAIAASLRAILARFTAQRPVQEGIALTPPGRADIAEWLRRLDLPVVDALRGAAAAEHADAWLALAETLLHVDRLASWAEASAAAFGDGVRARQAAQRHRQERRIADTLIAAYPALTGRRIAISRASTGGPPGGPLIRFLQQMYCRIAASTGKKPALAPLARDAALAPSAETLARWIRDHRPSSSR